MLLVLHAFYIAESAPDTLLINEIAPRPHNSGHYTIEACKYSQFEDHLRAILGSLLGNTRMKVPSAVMVNLLGPPSETIDLIQRIMHF